MTEKEMADLWNELDGAALPEANAANASDLIAFP